MNILYFLCLVSPNFVVFLSEHQILKFKTITTYALYYNTIFFTIKAPELESQTVQFRTDEGLFLKA